ncbi:retinol dehydrogenase 7-like [Babylonia areolata]|uniref:retinol dehydrogenase 7-like n=1 Tax=Babylonia areolata TaxID=304850 RepID=UPI003FD00CD4
MVYWNWIGDRFPALHKMREALLKSIICVPDVIADKAIFITNFFNELTWSTLILTLALTYFAVKALLWQWRLGNFAHRYVLVTGCDTGFGFELVKRLDTLGFQVFAGCLTSEGVKRVTTVTTRRVMPLSLDVTSVDNIRQVVDHMTSTLPPGSGLWAVVNNAGILPSMAPLELTPLDLFQRTLAVNLLGVVEVTRACLPLVRRSRGRVVNMSSVAGRHGFTSVDYTVSKFALEGFSDCLRREVYRDGVHVATVTPGGFQTGLCHFSSIFSNMEHAFSALSPEVQRHYGKDYVTSRMKFFESYLRHFSWGSSSLSHVTDVYEHALTARFPRVRYVVGRDAALFFRPLWCMPDWVGDVVWNLWPLSAVLR